MKKTELVQAFEKATELGVSYIGIRVRMKGYPDDELIINPLPNFSMKLEYYQKVYDDDLQHRFSPDVRIIDAAYGNSLAFIEESIKHKGENAQ
ncbi:hypothetical protein [Bacillus amyloliquefaciens]|uniref:hypothetical protein n=1 Tax=Bacillus amyloliquefaciens TaxID=1390 RepID=UPI002DBB3CA6|nr:hypothetical protein [Bacillus amyloliquefaciens]MEC3841531.1 hypothetical protein [Bacillus amyloliquefaciens]